MSTKQRTMSKTPETASNPGNMSIVHDMKLCSKLFTMENLSFIMENPFVCINHRRCKFENKTIFSIVCNCVSIVFARKWQHLWCKVIALRVQWHSPLHSIYINCWNPLTLSAFLTIDFDTEIGSKKWRHTYCKLTDHCQDHIQTLEPWVYCPIFWLMAGAVGSVGWNFLIPVLNAQKKIKTNWNQKLESLQLQTRIVVIKRQANTSLWFGIGT